MTVLQGHFAILMVITAPDPCSTESLEAALAQASKQFGLVVAVRQLPEVPGGGYQDHDSEPLSIVVHGSDRTGIVHAIADSLAERGANVVELSTQLVGDQQSDHVYVMTLRALAERGSADEVIDGVIATAKSLGVHCTARRDDADVL
jgi:glycine cleavage system transcriptional repressor